MESRLSRYWAYQLFGWGLFVLINVLFASVFDKFNYQFVSRLSIFVGLGFTISHLMRYAIIRSNLLMKPVQQQLVGFLLVTLMFAAVAGCLETLLTLLFGVRSRQEASLTDAKIIIMNTFVSTVYLFIWNCIYLLYHLIQRRRIVA